jgi:hypothetical protein
VQEFDEEGENQPPVGAALQALPGIANGHVAKPPLQVPSQCGAVVPACSGRHFACAKIHISTVAHLIIKVVALRIDAQRSSLWDPAAQTQAIGEDEAAMRGISIGSGVPADAEFDEQSAVPPAIALAQVWYWTRTCCGPECLQPLTS